MIAEIEQGALEVAFVVQLGGIAIAGIAAWASVKAARTGKENQKQLQPTNGDERPAREMLEIIEAHVETMGLAVRGNSRRLDQQGREIGALEVGQTAQNEVLDHLTEAIDNHQVFCAHNIDLFHGLRPGGKRRTDPPPREEKQDGLE